MVENIKKELGAFYTPKHTVDYMVSRLDGFDKKSKLAKPAPITAADNSDIKYETGPKLLNESVSNGIKKIIISRIY